MRKEDKREFRYFRRLFRESCSAIDARVCSGLCRPWTKSAIDALKTAAEQAYPRRAPPPEDQRRKRRSRRKEPGENEAAHPPFCVALPPGPLRIGVFIGSFDPFQMTHIQTALRYLSGSDEPADLVLVVPEGSYSARKPGRSEYGYRYDLLRRQIEYAFSPFIIPLDIGERVDTIGIVDRLIALFRGRKLSLTHVLGSDVLPLAVEWLPQDLAIWHPEAERYEVELDLRMFVVKRGVGEGVASLAGRARRLGVPVQIDRKLIRTPSSTALRERGVFTIVFPTTAVLEKMEVVFRYGMNSHWLTQRPPQEPDWFI